MFVYTLQSLSLHLIEFNPTTFPQIYMLFVLKKIIYVTSVGTSEEGNPFRVLTTVKRSAKHMAGLLLYEEAFLSMRGKVLMSPFRVFDMFLISARV